MATPAPHATNATRRSARWWAIGALAALIWLVAIPTGVRAQDEAPAVAQLPLLAERGHFDEVLAALTVDEAYKTDARVASLITDLQRYHEHEAEQNLQRQKAYATAVEDVSKRLQEGKLDEALISAIEASNVAASPQATLEDPTIVQLIHRAQAVAEEAERSGDWLEAMNLYRGLDLLFDENGTYRDRLNRAIRHVRVLRLYAPAELDRMLAVRSQRLGKDQPAPARPDEDSWQDTVRGVELAMLRQVMAQAARRHIDGGGYQPLLGGALDAMAILAESHGLDQTFPGLGDPKKVSEFRRQLASLRQQLDQRSGNLNFLEAAALVDRIVAINAQTVNLPEAVLTYELTEGVVNSLDDFSAVIWPREKENFSRNTQGKFFGVGIQISIRDDRLIVVSPLEGTPAHRAGIRAGDVIVSVDGRDTSTWALDRAVREITGPEGTEVTLGIERLGAPDTLQFKLKRAEIVIESIRGWERRPTGGWDYFIDRPNKIGYIRLSQFVPQSAADLDRAINQMEEEGGVEALILDLRFNPGGLLSSAVEVADRFLSSGTIVSTVGSDGGGISQFRARADHTYPFFPVVILVNEGSASASEIVAGALQDYHRALVIGTRSFGKGSVQDLFPLTGETAYLKLTTQYYRLPKGRIIHRKPNARAWGIEPDLEARMTTKQVADALEFRQQVDVLHQDNEPASADPAPPSAKQILDKAIDPQLEAAVLVLKTRLVARHMALANSTARQPSVQ